MTIKNRRSIIGSNKSGWKVKYLGKYVDFYCGDYNKELKKIINPVMKKNFGWLAQKDYDDFYSSAAQVVWECEKSFDETKGISFRNYLIPCIHHRIKTQITHANRYKRTQRDPDGNPVCDISMDAPVGDDEESVLSDLIPSDFDMDLVIEKSMGECQEKRIEQYLKSLLKIQRQIVELKMDQIPASEIKTRLGLSSKQYKQHCQELKSFANVSILYQNIKQTEYEKGEHKMDTQAQTMENCKTDKISIASIIKKIDKHTIRFDHPLQRESDQWSPAMKGNLISDILQGNKLHPLIFAEQIINGAAIIWDLDGKQRCTNAYLFYKDGFKISKNIRRFLIRYQIVEKDKNGRDILDENGYPVVTSAEVDIRGKKFSELPEELRDRFLDYSFNYDQYLNCSESDIGYHIERYNDGKPMSASQKGIARLGTRYAEMVRSISGMSFFKNVGNYKASEFKNGTICRIVVESVMTAKFPDHWNKNQEVICNYLKEHASAADFRDFEEMVSRIEKVVTAETALMFDAKDSFLWFGLFDRFLDMGQKDERFIEFMSAFSKTLHKKEVDKITYDELCVDKNTGKPRSTKDRSIVMSKMKLLEKLLADFAESAENVAD